MFSPIECRLRPSHLALGVCYLPVLAISVAAFLAGVPLTWLLPLVSVIAVSLWRLRVGREACHSLRWQGSRVTLCQYPGASAETFDWHGRGRRNAWYLRLRLHSEAGRYDLMVWRDAVSDASWRALNACYRVQEAALANDPADTAEH